MRLMTGNWTLLDGGTVGRSRAGMVTAAVRRRAGRWPDNWMQLDSRAERLPWTSEWTLRAPGLVTERCLTGAQWDGPAWDAI